MLTSEPSRPDVGGAQSCGSEAAAGVRYWAEASGWTGEAQVRESAAHDDAISNLPVGEPYRVLRCSASSHEHDDLGEFFPPWGLRRSWDDLGGLIA